MMKHISITLTLLLLLASTAWGRMGVLALGGGGAASASCPASPSISNDSHDTGLTLGPDPAYYYVGIVNTGASSIPICQVDIYARENGDLTGQTLYVEVWGTDSGDFYALTTKQSDITSINATLLSSTIGYYTITFPSSINLTQYQALVFTMRASTGETNNITFAYAASGNLIANVVVGGWTAAKTEGIRVANADMRIKIYGN